MKREELKKLSIGDPVVFAPLPWQEGITMIYRGFASPASPDGNDVMLKSESLNFFVFTHESNIRGNTKSELKV